MLSFFIRYLMYMVLGSVGTIGYARKFKRGKKYWVSMRVKKV
jgi:multisubunit Na+/H+ antiporter MnhF subunit